MRTRKGAQPNCWFLLVLILCAGVCQAQFSGSIQGGIFTAGQFTAPGFGSEGNEKSNGFREPSFAETDVSFYKENRIWERVNLQLRFEFYDIFNRPNLTNVDANPVDATFGKALSQQLPRWWQIGARVTF